MTLTQRLANAFGYRLVRAKRTRNFLAAAANRFTKTWFGFLVAPDTELWSDLATLRGRSRQVIRDNPYAASMQRVWVDNVAGPNGLQHYPLITKRDGSLNTTRNARVKLWWQDWGQRGCTVDGRYTWVDVQRMAVATEFADGEFLALKRRDARNPTGYALQLLDPDQLDETLMQPAGPNGNEIRMGVELDANDAPVAYHIWERHPNGPFAGGAKRERIAAEEVIHYFEPQRPGQTRGIPRLTPALYRLKMLDGYEEAELEAARVGALSGVTYEQDPEHPLDTGTDKPAGEIPMDLEPGSARLLPPGVKANFHKAEHPATAVVDYIRLLLRSLGVAVGLAYHTFTGDATQSNYSSTRIQELLQRDVFRSQHRRLAAHLVQLVYRDAIRAAFIRGVLVLPGEDDGPWSVAAFAGRGWTWVDPPKDLDAAERELALRLNTRSAIARENGRDFEDILRDWHQDMKLAQEWEVELPDPAQRFAPKAIATPAKEQESDDEE